MLIIDYYSLVRGMVVTGDGVGVSFDDVVCWPAAGANTTITIPCPGYVNLLDTEGKDSKPN